MSDQNQAPLPQRKLSTGLVILLWALRLYVVLAVPLVVYAFVKALHQAP